MIVCNNLERDAASNDKLFERSADRLALFIQHRNDFGKMAGSRKDLIKPWPGKKNWKVVVFEGNSMP